MKIIKKINSFLKQNGVSWEAIEYICANDEEDRTFLVDKKAFEKTIKDYDTSDYEYFCLITGMDFFFVGKDWWVTLETYDGQSFLYFHKRPEKPKKTLDISDLIKGE